MINSFLKLHYFLLIHVALTHSHMLLANNVSLRVSANMDLSFLLRSPGMYVRSYMKVVF